MTEEEESWYVKMYKTFIGRFFDGDGGVPNSRRSMSHFFELMFPFHAHPGPINSVIEEAHDAGKSVLLFVYSQYNQNSEHIFNILKNEQIIASIQNNYVFYPMLATTKEGMEVATHFYFSALPIIVILRPNGTTLNESRVFVFHEGMISKDTLLSYIQVESTAPNEEVPAENHEEDHHEQETGQQVENLLGDPVESDQNQEREVKREYTDDMLNLEEYKSEDAINISFIFPEKDTLEFRFDPNSECRLLYEFVKSVMESSIELTTGTEKKKIPNDKTPIKDVVIGKHVVIYCSLL